MTELAEFTARDYEPGVVRHIVLLHLLPDADSSLVAERFHALIRSTRQDGERYILSIESGGQLSLEGVGDGYELGFIVSFASLGDRNYYVGRPVVDDPDFFDPEHEAFKQWLGPMVERVLVFDFSA